jgi:hypothetical protein
MPKSTPTSANRLEEAIAILIRNQAEFVRDHAELRRDHAELRRAVDAIHADVAEMKAQMAEVIRVVGFLTEGVREKFCFQPPPK